MAEMTFRQFVWVVALSFALASGPDVNAASRPKQKPPPANFEREIRPLLERYCYSCHGEKRKGDLDLRVFTSAEKVQKSPEVFEKVLKNLLAHEMPPESRPQPTRSIPNPGNFVTLRARRWLVRRAHRRRLVPSLPAPYRSRP